MVMDEDSNKESTPLLSNNNTYYFKNSDRKTEKKIETHPLGATEEDFAPRTLGTVAKKPTQPVTTGFLAKLFGGSKNNDAATPTAIGGSAAIRLVKPRAAPIKIEPKVFFASERTFLGWMHISIILAGFSIAILAVADTENTGKQLYGLIMLPVAISFLVYSMYQYVKRSYMIRNKLPGPYDDTVGPTILGIMLMISITAQFAIKLNSITK